LTWLVKDGETAKTWATAINTRVGSGWGADGKPSRKLLVFINPVSGTGKGRSIWSTTLRCDAKTLDRSITVFQSPGKGDALGGSSAEAVDLNAFMGVVVVGGDGTMFEVSW
ncbi:unnamed protein product, partial [Discosporangium mesarthrocarpum]